MHQHQLQAEMSANQHYQQTAASAHRPALDYDFEYTEIWDILWQRSQKAWEYLFNIQHSFQSCIIVNYTFWLYNKTRTHFQDILNLF